MELIAETLHVQTTTDWEMGNWETGKVSQANGLIVFSIIVKHGGTLNIHLLHLLCVSIGSHTVEAFKNWALHQNPQIKQIKINNTHLITLNVHEGNQQIRHCKPFTFKQLAER